MNQTNRNSLFFPLGKLEDAGKIKKKTFIFHGLIYISPCMPGMIYTET